MQNRKSSAYWDARESTEQAWMKEQLAKDERFNKELDRAYQVAIDNINKEIQANIDKIGGVRNLVTASQMAEYERLAKQAVDHANELMKAGHKVTKKDFSPEVNARLKVYNATMRVNQLELMKSKIAVHNLNLGMDIQAKIADKLYDDYTKEMERQAGILGLSARNASLWTDREVMNIISAQSANGVFSQRIWANTDVLKAKLDGILATGIIRGSNPREMARYLRDQVSDTFKNAVYASERLARTESARVQHKAQLKSLKDNGYDFCKWHLEPGACKICIGIREDAPKYGLGVYRTEDVPDIPVHPNCRCAISAYWVDEEEKKYSLIDLYSPTIDDYSELNRRLSLAIEGFQRVSGINVKESINKGTFSDINKPYNDVKAQFMRYLLRSAGYDQLPKEVKTYSEHKNINKFLGAKSKETIFYRGFSSNDLNLKEQKEQLFHAEEYRISGARSSDYGRGIYVSAFKPLAERYAKSGNIIELGVSNKSKVLLMNQVDFKRLSEFNSIKPDYIGMKFKNNKTDINLDIIAILSGYDIIKASEKDAAMCILNRGLLQWKK